MNNIILTIKNTINNSVIFLNNKEYQKAHVIYSLHKSKFYTTKDINNLPNIKSNLLSLVIKIEKNLDILILLEEPIKYPRPTMIENLISISNNTNSFQEYRELKALEKILIFIQKKVQKALLKKSTFSKKQTKLIIELFAAKQPLVIVENKTTLQIFNNIEYKILNSNEENESILKNKTGTYLIDCNNIKEAIATIKSHNCNPTDFIYLEIIKTKSNKLITKIKISSHPSLVKYLKTKLPKYKF